MSSGGRRRGANQNFSSEDQALNMIAREAEARLSAKRAARAEARSIRMKELERQQKEADEKMDKEYQLNLLVEDAPKKRLSQRAVPDEVAATRNSDGFVKSLQDSLREVEDKYKKAMVSNAQLDNEKQALSYQVDYLKDMLGDEEENVLNFKDELSQLNREYNNVTRKYERSMDDLERVKYLLSERDRILEEYGINPDGTKNPEHEEQHSPSLPNGLDSSTSDVVDGSPTDKAIFKSQSSVGSTTNSEERDLLLEQIKSLKDEVAELRRENDSEAFQIRDMAVDELRPVSGIERKPTTVDSCELERSTFVDVSDEARAINHDDAHAEPSSNNDGAVVNNNEKNEDFEVIDTTLNHPNAVQNFEDASYESSTKFTESLSSTFMLSETVESEELLGTSTEILDDAPKEEAAHDCVDPSFLTVASQGQASYYSDFDIVEEDASEKMRRSADDVASATDDTPSNEVEQPVVIESQTEIDGANSSSSNASEEPPDRSEDADPVAETMPSPSEEQQNADSAEEVCCDDADASQGAGLSVSSAAVDEDEKQNTNEMTSDNVIVASDNDGDKQDVISRMSTDDDKKEAIVESAVITQTEAAPSEESPANEDAQEANQTETKGDCPVDVKQAIEEAINAVEEDSITADEQPQEPPSVQPAESQQESLIKQDLQLPVVSGEQTDSALSNDQADVPQTTTVELEDGSDHLPPSTISDISSDADAKKESLAIDSLPADQPKPSNEVQPARKQSPIEHAPSLVAEPDTERKRSNSGIKILASVTSRISPEPQPVKERTSEQDSKMIGETSSGKDKKSDANAAIQSSDSPGVAATVAGASRTTNPSPDHQDEAPGVAKQIADKEKWHVSVEQSPPPVPKERTKKKKKKKKKDKKDKKESATAEDVPEASEDANLPSPDDEGVNVAGEVSIVVDDATHPSEAPAEAPDNAVEIKEDAHGAGLLAVEDEKRHSSSMSDASDGELHDDDAHSDEGSGQQHKRTKSKKGSKKDTKKEGCKTQ